jgi:hypothetical protein
MAHRQLMNPEGKLHPQFGFSDEESCLELVLNEAEILADFWEQGQSAAERNLVVPEELRIAAKAFCRMQQRLNPDTF